MGVEARRAGLVILDMRVAVAEDRARRAGTARPARGNWRRCRSSPTSARDLASRTGRRRRRRAGAPRIAVISGVEPVGVARRRSPPGRRRGIVGEKRIAPNGGAGARSINGKGPASDDAGPVAQAGRVRAVDTLLKVVPSLIRCCIAAIAATAMRRRSGRIRWRSRPLSRISLMKLLMSIPWSTPGMAEGKEMMNRRARSGPKLVRRREKWCCR